MAEVTKINFKGTVLDIRDASAARASDLAAKQDVLVSGTNIKTINGQSLVGNGNITVVGEKGDKGDAGDVNITDGQLNELTVVNDLEHNTQGDGAVLSAYMGYFLGQKMGKVVNANDGKTYRIWVGTQAQLDALGSNIEKDVIYLVGVVPTIEITAIGINTVEGDVNFVNLHADLYPPTTTQENVTWSIDNDIDFSIVSDGLDAVLRVLSTADDSTVNVTCRSVEKPSVSTVETLVKSYDPTVPITAITGITHSTASTNKEQFVAVVEPEGGNTPAIVWSVVATPQNAASIDTNGLLTIIDDCTVVVTATSGSNTFSTNEINLQWQQDPNAPIVWEDANMEAFMLGKVSHANPNYITINEAASYTNNAFASGESAASYQFGDIKGVVTKFNEWQYFTGLTKINMSNFTALTEVTMPSTVLIETTLAGNSGTRFSGTLIQYVEIPSGVTSFDGNSFNSCAELENIIFPSTLTTLVSLSDNCPKLRTIDFSGTSLGAYTLNRAKTNAEIIKLPPSLETMQKSDGNALQLTRDMPNIRYIEIGTAQGGSQISAINVNDYQGKSVALILHTETPPSFTWAGVAPSAIYVPDAAVATYQAASGFSTYSSIIKGLSELPSGWDSTTSN